MYTDTTRYIDNPILAAAVKRYNSVDVTPYFDVEVVLALKTLRVIGDLEIDEDGNANSRDGLLQLDYYEIEHYARKSSGQSDFVVYFNCAFDISGCDDRIDGFLDTFATDDQARAFIRELADKFNA